MPRLKDAAVKAQAEKEDRDPRLAQIEALAAELDAEGIDVNLEHGRLLPPVPDRDTDVDISVGAEEHLRLGIVSDTHLGSKQEQLSSLRAFYAYAEAEGVHAFVHGGDLTQGIYKKRQMAQGIHAHGSDAQAAYAIEVYPRSPVQTHIIGGNHDWTFMLESGTNIVRLVAEHRPDLTYLGQDASYLTIDGFRFYVIHPDGGNTYAKSYKPQKVVEAIPRDRGVQVALLGHYHTEGKFETMDTQALMLPCFQGSYGYLIRKSLYPSIGGIILDLWRDGDTDRITRLRHEYVRYPELENDWDADVSLEVNRGNV